jgi:hypothetical protein
MFLAIRFALFEERALPYLTTHTENGSSTIINFETPLIDANRSANSPSITLFGNQPQYFNQFFASHIKTNWTSV